MSKGVFTLSDAVAIKVNMVPMLTDTLMGRMVLRPFCPSTIRLLITLVLVSGFGYQFAGFGYQLFVMHHFFV